jgi:hypothetical protein
VLLGPAVIITVGVLFLLQQARGGYFDFGNTYPVILVVIGAILLASALAPMEGHSSSSTVLPAAAQPAPGSTPGSTTSSSPGQGQ